MIRFKLCVVALLVCTSSLLAQSPPQPAKTPTIGANDPLHLMPSEASGVFKIEQPRAFLESLVTLDAYQSGQQFPQVREFLDSNGVRRFFQGVKALETALEHPWPELVDAVAGDGIVLGFPIEVDNPPVLLIVQGRDEALIEKAFTILLTELKDETSRQGNPNAVTQKTYRGVVVNSIGDDFFAARIGKAVYVSNKSKAMEKALNLAKPSAGEKPTSVVSATSLPEARAIAGAKPFAWGWVNLLKLKETQASKDFYESTRKDILQTLVVGSTIDAVKRSDYVALVLDGSPGGYALRVRLPAKRSELDPTLALHAPMNGEAGSLPLLEPPGTVYSQSFYLDLAHFWKNRKDVILGDNLKDLEKAESDISKVLPGTTFGKFLESSGPYHRIVSAQTNEKLYSVVPGQVLPATAYVGSFTDPAFGETAEGVLRSAALIVSLQTKMKMSETTHNGVKLVTYRFAETGPAPYDDVENLRFNAAPTFAITKNSVIVGSTPGIVKLLLPMLEDESQASPARAVWRARGYLDGAALLLKANPETTITQTILSQGVGLAAATKQVEGIVAWLKTAGTLGASIDHAPNFYEFQFNWTFTPKPQGAAR